jgi:hypothetical protein
MPTSKPYSSCIVCSAPVSTWSRYCTKHKTHANRHGDPNARPIPMSGKYNFVDVELRLARRYMARYAEHPSVIAAIRFATELQKYRAETPWTYDLQTEHALHDQKNKGAEPSEIVARIVAFYLYLQRRPFRTPTAEQVALGRLVLHVVPTPGRRWGMRVYRAAGQLAANLGVFAQKLLQRVERDAAEANALLEEAATI